MEMKAATETQIRFILDLAALLGAEDEELMEEAGYAGRPVESLTMKEASDMIHGLRILTGR